MKVSQVMPPYFAPEKTDLLVRPVITDKTCSHDQSDARKNGHRTYHGVYADEQDSCNRKSNRYTSGVKQCSTMHFIQHVVYLYKEDVSNYVLKSERYFVKPSRQGQQRVGLTLAVLTPTLTLTWSFVSRRCTLQRSLRDGMCRVCFDF